MLKYDVSNFRLGQTCKNIAGLLFREEVANKMGVTSCTSVPCSWNVPDTGKRLLEPKRIKDMQLTNASHDKNPGSLCIYILSLHNETFIFATCNDYIHFKQVEACINWNIG